MLGLINSEMTSDVRNDGCFIVISCVFVSYSKSTVMYNLITVFSRKTS